MVYIRGLEEASKIRAVILWIRSRIGGILKAAWSRGIGVRLGRFPTFRRHFDCRICRDVWLIDGPKVYERPVDRDYSGAIAVGLE
jgi:hypothetical protein